MCGLKFGSLFPPSPKPKAPSVLYPSMAFSSRSPSRVCFLTTSLLPKILSPRSLLLPLSISIADEERLLLLFETVKCETKTVGTTIHTNQTMMRTYVVVDLVTSDVLNFVRQRPSSALIPSILLLLVVLMFSTDKTASAVPFTPAALSSAGNRPHLGCCEESFSCSSRVRCRRRRRWRRRIRGPHHNFSSSCCIAMSMPRSDANLVRRLPRRRRSFWW